MVENYDIFFYQKIVIRIFSILNLPIKRIRYWNIFKKYINSEIHEKASEKEKNALIFEYCLNICEMKGITYKADKMLIISEMSRSIFWGCIFTIVINMYLVFVCLYCDAFLYYEIPLLIISAIIFFYRKIRYENIELEYWLEYFWFIYSNKLLKSKKCWIKA